MTASTEQETSKSLNMWLHDLSLPEHRSIRALRRGTDSISSRWHRAYFHASHGSRRNTGRVAEKANLLGKTDELAFQSIHGMLPEHPKSNKEHREGISEPDSRRLQGNFVGWAIRSFRRLKSLTRNNGVNDQAVNNC